MTHYVLRAYCFGYNDENFYVCGTRINDVFDNRDKAEAAYRKAQLQYLRDIDLAEHENIFNGDPAYIARLDKYIREKTGDGITGDNEWVDMGTDIHAKLSDDDLFEFGEMGELFAYKLIAFDDEPVFHTLWNPQEEKYFQVIDEGYEGLVYGASQDELMKLVEERDITLNWDGMEISGTIDELSDNPTLLRQYLETADEIEYDHADNVLRFGYPEAKVVVGLNALLKAPIFEVRELTIDEVKELEKEIGYYSGEPVSFMDGCGWTLLKILAWIVVPVGLITALRCGVGTCDNVLATFGDTAWTAFKWLVMFVLGIVVLIWGLSKIGTAFRRKKKRR